MRSYICLICLAALGCGSGNTAGPARDIEEEVFVPLQSAPPLIDLRTRKTGVDWPRFLGPQANSKSPEKEILTQWPSSGPPIVWQRKLGTGYGMGTISKGRFFQLDRVRDRERLTCLESETGKFIWEFAYPTDYKDYWGYNNGPRASPVVDGERVYIHGAEGMLHCLRAVDGGLVWKVDTKAKFGVVQNHFGVGSTPVVEDGLLIVMVGGSPPESKNATHEDLHKIDGNGSGIVAFDKYTGQVKYKITDELASYATPQLTSIGGRRWCFVFARGGLVGFEPAVGQVDFHYPWRAKISFSVNASTPVVVDNQVFITETYGPGSSLLKVRPGGYDVVWRDDPKASKRGKGMMAHWNTPIYHQGYLYGCSGRNPPDGELRCIEWKSGKVMWSVPGLARTSLLYVDGHFVCLGEYGDLRLLKANPRKYEQVAMVLLKKQDLVLSQTKDARRPQNLLKFPAWAAPILSHGLLYVRGDDRLVCLELIPADKKDG